MLSIKERIKCGIPMEKSFLDNIRQLLTTIFKSKANEQKKVFFVYGEKYDDEVVVAASLYSSNDPNSIPVTYIASLEIKSGVDETKGLKILVDSIGVFFEHYFLTPDWDEYNPVWEKTSMGGQEFNYMTSRENLMLMIEADLLL